MKKYLLYFLPVFMLLPTLISCSDDDDDGTSYWDAKVTVNVKNSSGEAKSGKAVYMYIDEEVTSSTSPGGAFSMLVTGEEGKAVFDVNLEDLNMPASQTITLYFAVFYTEDNETMIAGSTNIKVKRGEAKKVELKTLF